MWLQGFTATQTRDLQGHMLRSSGGPRQPQAIPATRKSPERLRSITLLPSLSTRADRRAR